MSAKDIEFGTDARAKMQVIFDELGINSNVGSAQVSEVNFSNQTRKNTLSSLNIRISSLGLSVPLIYNNNNKTLTSNAATSRQATSRKKIYDKLLKKHSQDRILLAGSLKVFPQRADDYLPVIASVDITNNEIWLGLANLAIKDGNYSMAQTYLNNSYYIDENNFKYYYYLSQVLKAKGDIEKSRQSLVKCSILNSDYEASMNSGR